MGLQRKSLIETLSELIEDSKEIIEEESEKIVEEYGGLVSPVSAVFLYAEKKGIRLNDHVEVEEDEKEPEMDISDISEDLQEVFFECKISEIKNTFHFNGGDGRGREVILYDDTGTIKLMLWGDQTEEVDSMSRGDIIRIYGYPDTYKGSLQVKLGKHGYIEKIDDRN